MKKHIDIFLLHQKDYNFSFYMNSMNYDSFDENFFLTGKEDYFVKLYDNSLGIFKNKQNEVSFFLKNIDPKVSPHFEPFSHITAKNHIYENHFYFFYLLFKLVKTKSILNNFEKDLQYKSLKNTYVIMQRYKRIDHGKKSVYIHEKNSSSKISMFDLVENIENILNKNDIKSHFLFSEIWISENTIKRIFKDKKFNLSQRYGIFNTPPLLEEDQYYFYQKHNIFYLSNIISNLIKLKNFEKYDKFFVFYLNKLFFSSENETKTLTNNIEICFSNLKSSEVKKKKFIYNSMDHISCFFYKEKENNTDNLRNLLNICIQDNNKKGFYYCFHDLDIYKDFAKLIKFNEFFSGNVT